MKRKHFFGLAVMTVTVIITLTGCAAFAEMFKAPEFPSDIAGTWERAFQSPYTNTLTITSRIFKDSTQDFHWIVQSVSGDAYTLRVSDSDYTYTIRVRLENGYLIFGKDNTTGEHDWEGTWQRK